MRHSELPLMCDIVIGSDDLQFRGHRALQTGESDTGDGIGIVYTMLLGINRAAISC